MTKEFIDARDGFIHKEKLDGKRGPFYNGLQPFSFDIGNSALFMNAVWQGYLDTAKTCVGLKSERVHDSREAFRNLASRIEAYFKTREEDDYDKLHAGWCSELIHDVAMYNSYPLRYGQAQRIINVAMKYLYCCEGSEEYSSKFIHCHMPLDKYTLIWFFLKTGILYTNWSYLTKDRYVNIQKEIREILGDNILEHEMVI